MSVSRECAGAEALTQSGHRCCVFCIVVDSHCSSSADVWLPWLQLV